MRSLKHRALARAITTAIAVGAAAASNALAAPQLEGLSQEQGRVLMDRIAVKIHQFIPGKLAVDEIEYITPAPLGQGFYLVSARKGRLVAMTDEAVTNVMLLQGYINVADGQKRDVLAAVRQKVAPAAAQGTGGTRRYMLHASEAIPMYSGERVVHVVCDPNSQECTRFTNDVLKRTPNVRAYIHAVSLVDPGNWREAGVRDALCWPEQARFAQWDRIVNAKSAAALPALGQPCTRDQYVDELTAAVRQGYGPAALPLITLPDGRTVAGAGMTAAQFDRLLATPQ